MANPDNTPKNEANTQDLKPVLINPIVIGDLNLASPTTQTTIGSNGAATALTANPVGYITINVGNSSFQIPYYNMA